jgi:hypothetical protein
MPATKPKPKPKPTKPVSKPKARAPRKRSTITLAALATRLDEIAAGQRAMEASMREVLHNLQIAQYPAVPCDEYTQRLLDEAFSEPGELITHEEMKRRLGV